MKWYQGWFRLNRKGQKGVAGTGFMVGIAAIVAIIVLTYGMIIPLMQAGVATSSIDAAIAYLERNGYVVFATNGDIIPSADDTFDIGSPTRQWRSLYVDGDSIHLGDRDLTDTGSQFRVDNVAIPRTATLVVAASNALAASRAQADYVCSGVNDHVEIQAALNTAGAGTVVLTEGDFVGDEFDVPDDVTLRGQGFSTTYTAANGIDYSGLIEIGSNSVIENLYIDGNGANQAGGNWALSIDAAETDSIIRNVWVTNGYLDNIVLENNVKRVTVSNSFSWNAGQGAGQQGSGIEVGASSGGDTAHNILIEGNHLWDNDQGGIVTSVHADVGEDGITDVIITNNITQDNESGVIIGTGPGVPANDSQHILIANHLDISSTGLGMEFDEASYVTIANSEIRDPGSFGIDIASTCDHFIIDGNLILNPTNYGMAMRATDSVVSGNKVFNASGTGNGIHVDTHRVLITGNVTNENAGDGLDLYDASYCTITGNQSMNNVGNGIKLRAGSTYNTITGNMFSDDQGAATQDNGIYEDTSADDYNYIAANIYSSNQVLAVDVRGVHSRTDIEARSAIFDLSGAATDTEVFHAMAPSQLVAYTIVYTEASSADAGVNVRIGRYQDGVALDDDYFDISVSEVSENLGYSKHFATGALTNKFMAAGDTVTVGTAGGKVGLGEVMLVLYIAGMAD